MRKQILIPALLAAMVFVLPFYAHGIHVYASSDTVDSSWCSGNGFSWDLTTSTCTLTGDASVAYGSSLVNPSGTTLVISSGTLVLQGGFTNNGALDITDSGLADHVAIIMQATCNPLSGSCSPENSLLTNHGTIDIQNTAGTSVNAVSTGIEVASGTLNNTGTINIQNSGGQFNVGIFSPTEGNAVLYPSNFLNYGTVNVANSGNGYGIEEDQSSGTNTITFSNTGTVNIENSGGYGFFNAAFFSNSGTFNLDNSGGHGLFSDTTLTNTESGTIKIENAATGLSAPIVQNQGRIIDEACGTYSMSGFASYSGNAIEHSNICIMSFSESGFSGETWGVSVDGTNHTTSGSFLTVTGLSQTSDYQYDSSVAVGTGAQYACSTGCSGSVSNTSGSTSANYQTQYYLTVTSPYGTTAGQGWHNAGSSTTFGLEQNFAGDNLVEFVFAGWSSTDPGGYSGTYPSPAGLTETITINNPVTETASWTPYYLVTFENTGCGSSSSRHLAAGSIATPPTQIPSSIFPITEARCILLSDNATTTPITGPTTIASTYQAQFLLTIDDPTGPNSSPASEWVNSGTTATLAVNSPIPGGPGLQYLASGWVINPSPLSNALTSRGDATSGTGSTASFPMLFFGGIRWNWDQQFTATQNGNWNDPATWGGASPPVTVAAGDTAIIPAGIIVTIPSGIAITNSGDITTYGQISNVNGGTITNSGIINTECGSTITGIVSGNQPVSLCDAIPPTLAISEPSNNAFLSHLSSVNGTASDDTSVSSVTGRVDSEPVTAATTTDNFAHWSLATEGIPTGLHTIQINATDSAGLVTTQTMSVTIDSMPPTVTGSANMTANADGWYNRPLQISWTGTDALDAINSCDSPTVYLGPDGSAIKLGGHCTDSAGNTGSGNVTIKYDSTPPSITGSPTTRPNANSWYDSDVSVHFACTDATSGVATCTPDQTVSTEGKGQQVTGTATDNAGNSANITVSGINIDKTPPVTTATPTGTAGNNDWFRSPVSASIATTDNISGIAGTSYSLDGTLPTPYSGSISITGDGIHTLAFNSTDNAGNVEKENTLTIKIDAVPPTVTGDFNTTSNANGWYNRPLQVSWFGTDATSGIASCDSPSIYSGPDSSSAPLAGHCIDNAGNTGTATTTIKYDSTPPTLTLPSDNTATFPTSPAGATVTFSSTNGTAASATDVTSGLATLTYSPASGSTFSIGTTTVTATATDKAGNQVTGTFHVTVLTPAGASQNLINDINSMSLDQGTAGSLDSKLSNVISSLNSNQNGAAKNQLHAFINEVNAQTGKKITKLEASQLNIYTQDIISSIS